MKATAQKQPAGFSPVKLELTFETVEELYAFQLRMAGHMVEYNVEAFPNRYYMRPCPITVGEAVAKPTYSYQQVKALPINPRLLCDADHYIASKVNDVLNKLEK